MRTYVENIVRSVRSEARARRDAAHGARPRRARSTFVPSVVEGAVVLRIAY